MIQDSIPVQEPFGGVDRLRLPHPALGRLTVREMLFFTLYHNLHHVRNVERRNSAGAPRTTAEEVS